MRFIDLFAGIGGFRMGMEMAGHECGGYIEIDKYARQSYEAIHDTKGEWTAHDIRTVDPRELPEADCYTAGFPCQSFSVAGRRGGFTDTRGTLFFEIMRLAKARKPEYLFLENVKGLLSCDGGKTFATIISTLAELGYNAEWQVLNSKDFGVPQNRERVFIVGHLRGSGGREVFPIRADGEQIDELQGQPLYTNTITARYEGAQATGTYVIESKQHAQEIIQINNPVHSNDRVYDCEGVSPTLNTMRRRFKADGEPMFTLNTQDRHGLYDGCHIRRLTPLECWRLQGFPDWAFWKAKDAGVSDSQLYKQAGNAVTVNVIYEIALKLREVN